MVCGKIKKQMGLVMLSSSLLLLLLLISMLVVMSSTPCKAASTVRTRFHTFKPHSQLQPPLHSQAALKRNHHQHQHQHQAQHHGDDDEILGADKRKVYTGPNPLHNR